MIRGGRRRARARLWEAAGDLTSCLVVVGREVANPRGMCAGGPCTLGVEATQKLLFRAGSFWRGVHKKVSLTGRVNFVWEFGICDSELSNGWMWHMYIQHIVNGYLGLHVTGRR